ncbi:hypothetical protein [Wielerella bovis]|uniref:hypothetical protein n=1 Tax=Wielerella bovis TaxID=2917790 RepID=UPI0020198AC3|nr:hypothetical protein [Wielerella bovis]MCG7657284.1 hypothetical protein [Wielerella bovis]MCG7659506.1 hypothetical protein [Wielerella bovis]
MSKFYVELRVDVGGDDYIPHTFIVLTDTNGKSYEYGFAPVKPSLINHGKIDTDPGHEYQFTTGKIPVSEQRFNDIKSRAEYDVKHPPFYNLPFGSHCGTWAANKLGIPDTSSLAPFASAIINSPYTQAI